MLAVCFVIVMAVTVFAGVLREHDASLIVRIINGAADRLANDVLLLLALPRDRLDTGALHAVQPQAHLVSELAPARCGP